MTVCSPRQHRSRGTKKTPSALGGWSFATPRRGRIAAAERAESEAALQAGDAGKIELERGEKPSTVKNRLRAASQETGIKVRSSWADKSQRTLLWKRTGL